MAKVAQIKNGRVYICAPTGGTITCFNVLSGGDPVFADYDENSGRVLVTTSNGWVHIYSDTGGKINTFAGERDIVWARWQGDKILVARKNGRQEIRDQNGGLISIAAW